MNPIRKGIALKVIALALFGLMDVCLKELSAHYGSFQVAFFRGLTAMPFVLGLVALHGDWQGLKTRRWGLHLLRGVLGVSMLASVIYAFSEMPLADAYAIFYAAPLFVTLASVFVLKESVGVHRWLALIVGLSAVLFMLKPTGDAIHLGALACLFGTLCYAVLVIIMKILHQTDSTAVQSFYFTLSITVGAGLMAFLDWQAVRAEDYWIFLTLGVTAALAQYVMTAAYKTAPASALAPFEYTAMIWALLFGYLFWAELPSQSMVIGAIVVAATGLYILYRERLHQSDTDPTLNFKP